MLPPEKRQELVREIKRRIRKVVYPPGYRLPVEPEFAKEFGVARETLRGALDILCKEQLIRRIPGKGTFVASSKSKYGTPQKQILVLASYADYFIRSGYFAAKHLNARLAGCLASAYQRYAQTALKKMERRKEFYTLEANDNYVIFSDKVLDGSDKEKGFDPSFLTFDFADVKTAQLNLRKLFESENETFL